MTLGELNALAVPAVSDALAACCASPHWVEQMLGARPFASRDAMLRASDDAWRNMAPGDIDAAIAHHPRIGEVPAATGGNSRAAEWSRGEQSGVANPTIAARDGIGNTAATGASSGAVAVAGGANAVAAALAQGNQDYEQRFGHRFIVCASGLSADAILAQLHARLANDPRTEQAVTSEELRKITTLRLDKLLSER